MNNRPVPELQTDPEFDELIQPREEKYLKELEENIFDHGCLEPVCVWNGIILDGRLRYKICTKWDIHFNIRRMYQSLLKVPPPYSTAPGCSFPFLRSLS